jgi:hypothetical protein
VTHVQSLDLSDFQENRVASTRLQLEHLTLLDHLGTSSIDNEIEESHPRRDDDHPTHQEVVIRALK